MPDKIKNIKLTKFLPLAVLALLAFLFTLPFVRGQLSKQQPSTLIDRPAPLTTGFIFGTEPVIVNFFASWCVTCRAEHNILTAIQKRHDIFLYGVAYKDKPEALEKYLENLGNSYQVIIEDPDGKQAMDWGVIGVPETFIIDTDGIIRYHHRGPITPDIYHDILQPVIKKVKK